MAFSSVPKFYEKVTFNPANITATQIGTENILTGVKQLVPGDRCVITAPSLEAGLQILPSFVVTAGAVPLKIWNFTGADINPASQSFYVEVI